MAVCSVCGASCRGKCAKCGTALCAAHKPTSTRAKCMLCKKRPTGIVPAVGGIAPYPGPPTPTLAIRSATPLAALSLTEQLAWIAERRDRLAAKQARERAHLDRRAGRGTHTPTDDAYEADQVLEGELIEILDLLVLVLQRKNQERDGHHE